MMSDGGQPNDDSSQEGAYPQEEAGFLAPIPQKLIAEIEDRMGISVVERDPYAQHVTPEHIDELIKSDDRENARNHERFRISATMFGVGLVASLIAICFLCWLFLYYSQPDLILPIVTAVAGFLAGFGVGRARRNGATVDEE